METSKGELVPGGLAMVYGLVVDVQYNGLIVITEAQPDSSSYKDVEFEDYCPGDWVCVHEEIEDGFGLFDSKNLMPIKPEADPLDVEEEQCQTA